ncbi:MAG: flavodoxin-dependent (E)-4-hydroxy-3-methylbut-2-enyl-diphosphate synthase, partial [Parafilimonas sp.]
SNVFAVGNTNETSVEELEMNGEQLEVNDEQSETRNEKRETNILPYSPFNYNRRETFAVSNIGDSHVPVVVADFSKLENITPQHLEAIGNSYNAETDKWNIGDAAADFIFTNKRIDFELPGTLRVVCYHKSWLEYNDKEKYLPILDRDQYMNDAVEKSSSVNFVMLDCYSEGYMQPPLEKLFDKLRDDKTAVICLSSTNKNAMQSVRRMFVEMMNNNIKNPVILITDSNDATMDESLIHYAAEAGGLLLDGFCDGVCLGYHFNNKQLAESCGQTTNNKLLNSIAFGILQATRTRISKTEYISCPSCGRTLFDLQETTAKIRSRTNHLKGVKIAIMGCIVNGPGEMADADFGYVGSGVGKITLYKGKDVVKRNVNNEVAVDELINLLKENGAWADPVEVLVSS